MTVAFAPHTRVGAALPDIVRSGVARAVPLVGNVAFAAVIARRYGVAALGVAGTVQLVVRVLGEARAAGWPTALVAESRVVDGPLSRALAAARLRRHRRPLALAGLGGLMAAGALLAWIGLVAPPAVVLAGATLLAVEGYAALRLGSGAAVALGRPVLAAAADLGLASAVSAVILLLPLGPVGPLGIPAGGDSALAAAAWATTLFALSLAATAAVLGHRLGILGTSARGGMHPPLPVLERSTTRSRRLIALNAMLGPATTTLVPLAVGWRSGSVEAGAFVAALRLGVAGPVVLSVLAPIYLRRLADADRTPRLRALVEAQLAGLALFAPFALVCLVAPGALLGLLSPDLADQGMLLRLIVLGQAINVATGPTDQVLNVSGRPHADTFTQLAGLVTIAGLLVVFPAGATAAAVALLLAQLVRNLAATALAWRS